MSVVNIALNEWARLFLSRRGWGAIITFALIWLVFLTYAIAPAASYVSSADFNFLAQLVFGSFDQSALIKWQSAEIALYWIFSLYLLPFFTMISAADQIASDRVRGTMRFLVLRTSRTTVFIGRFIGQYLIQLFVILITVATVLGLVALKSPENLPVALSEVPIVIVNLALVLLSYVALMALVSVLAKTAWQAIMLAIVAWIVLWFVIGYVQNNFGPLPVLDWVLPGSQLSQLVRMGTWDTLVLAPIPLVQTVVLLGLGWFAFKRCDL